MSALSRTARSVVVRCTLTTAYEDEKQFSSDARERSGELRVISRHQQERSREYAADAKRAKTRLDEITARFAKRFT